MHGTQLLLLLALTLGSPTAALAQESAPPSRDLLLGLTEQARLAGTSGSLRGARYVAGVLERAGWKVDIDARVVMLSLPRRIDFSIFADAQASEPASERHERFDPDAIPAGDVPLYSAYSASGRVRGPVVDAGHGLRADFERLRSSGIELKGCIALVRYGKSYRGIKVDLATEYGCAAVLLFTPANEDGAGKGPIWPKGPWKPDTVAQNGSISPMSRAPGDPSTPGYGSPRPGVQAARVPESEIAQALPRILCLPIGAREAQQLQASLREVPTNAALAAPERIGPGPIEVELAIDAPRDLRTIYNVIATLAGADAKLVIAGNHRDAWMRGAHDAGSGTVSLMRAAQQLGDRARKGWVPKHTLQLGFWDAEEFGLIGSTEYGEANAERLRRDALVYVNGDTAVSGTNFSASGSPGLVGSLLEVLDRVPSAQEGKTLGSEWRASFGEKSPRFGLPGSGSDFAVFLHHLSVPVIDFNFGGNSGGQYHTGFDDFAMVERYLDPGFVGHELAGRFLCELLADFADRPTGGFDNAEAARALALVVREAGAELQSETPWLGEGRADRLAQALENFAAAASENRDAPGQPFYAAIALPQGLPGRPWYRNPMWAPGLETGYSSQTLPTLRLAASRGEAFLEAEVSRMAARIDDAARSWRRPSR